MGSLLRVLLPLMLITPCSSQQIRVIAVRNCRSGVMVEVRFSNSFHGVDISTPLSAFYQSGHTLHSARVEFYDLTIKQWSFTGRGTDVPPAGTRVLEPGEAVNDLIEAGLQHLAGLASDKAKFRAAVSYQVGNQNVVRTAYSPPFTLAEYERERFTDEPWMNPLLSECVPPLAK